MPDALFVAVEGVDRAGKTTLVAALANTWRARGLAAATRAEPSRGHGAAFSGDRWSARRDDGQPGGAREVIV
jgi:thymidylate kinase